MTGKQNGLFRNPELLHEKLKNANPDSLVIIDEVQKIPQLLNEVHWLITCRNQSVENRIEYILDLMKKSKEI